MIAAKLHFEIALNRWIAFDKLKLLSEAQASVYRIYIMDIFAYRSTTITQYRRCFLLDWSNAVSIVAIPSKLSATSNQLKKHAYTCYDGKTNDLTNDCKAKKRGSESVWERERESSNVNIDKDDVDERRWFNDSNNWFVCNVCRVQTLCVE